MAKMEICWVQGVGWEEVTQECHGERMGTYFSINSFLWLLLTFIRDLGLDLQTTEIFLLNDLGSELCIEKKRGKKKEKETHPTERGEGG